MDPQTPYDVGSPSLEITTYKMKRMTKWQYPGGKGCVGVYQNLINCMPPHEIYIEAFLGGGAVLRHKRPATRNVGIDLDDNVIRAWANVNSPSLEVIQGDAFEILNDWCWQGHDALQTLIYCDPPYLQHTRRSSRPLYEHDLKSDEQHARLLQILLRLPCMVMLSGYRSPLYESLIGHWRQVHFPTVNRAGLSTVETVWLNFPPPSALHDYKYLGRGFRERERIKRRRERWRVRLSRMSQLERQAVLWALHDFSRDPELSQTEGYSLSD